jgi:hypothetical protein
MTFQDFREFLDALRKAGELLEVDRAVSPELEVAKAMKKSAAVSGPAIIFKNNGTAFPLVGGVYNTRSKALIAFQTNEKDVFDRVLHGMAARIPPIVVEDAPVPLSRRRNQALADPLPPSAYRAGLAERQIPSRRCYGGRRELPIAEHGPRNALALLFDAPGQIIRLSR